MCEVQREQCECLQHLTYLTDILGLSTPFKWYELLWGVTWKKKVEVHALPYDQRHSMSRPEEEGTTRLVSTLQLRPYTETFELPLTPLVFLS